MSLYFLINNLDFAFGMVGAIILMMAAWLSFDAYRLQKDISVKLRFSGLALFAVWQVIYSLNTANDLLLYFGFILFILALALLLTSFVKTKALAVNAVIIIPAFSAWSHGLYFISMLLLSVIAYLALRQSKREFNKTWIPFALCFALLAAASLLNIFGAINNQSSFTSILSRLLELAGFAALAFWVWQYMRLRINESFVMISVGVTFLLATIVTLAFSTILINRVALETSNNLLTDVKVLDFSLASMKEESLAKAELIARDTDMASALDARATAELEQLGEKYLEQYNLGFLTVADPTGKVLVRAHALSKRGDTLSGERAFEEAALGNNFVTIESNSVEGFSIRAASPVLKKGKVIGTIVAGFPLDNAFADRQKKLTGLDMFIYDKDTSIAGTFFDADGRTRLIGETVTNTQIKNDVLVLGKTEAMSADIFGTLFHAAYLPIQNGDGKVIGMATVAKPEQDIVNIANATNRLTLITVVLIISVLFIPIYLVSKRFTRTL